MKKDLQQRWVQVYCLTSSKHGQKKEVNELTAFANSDSEQL